MDHNLEASPAKEPRSGLPKGYRSGFADGLATGDPADGCAGVEGAAIYTSILYR